MVDFRCPRAAALHMTIQTGRSVSCSQTEASATTRSCEVQVILQSAEPQEAKGDLQFSYKWCIANLQPDLVFGNRKWHTERDSFKWSCWPNDSFLVSGDNAGHILTIQDLICHKARFLTRRFSFHPLNNSLWVYLMTKASLASRAHVLHRLIALEDLTIYATDEPESNYQQPGMWTMPFYW
jgi:hypothetical protein